MAWLDRQPAESVRITSITRFEARLGLALPPTGRRRQPLEAAFARLMKQDLQNRVLDFYSAARHACHPKGAEFWGSECFDSRSLGGSRRVTREFKP